MAIVERLFEVVRSLSFTSILALIPAAIVLAHVIPYFLDPYGLRSYPGPFLAKFSDLWLGWVAAHGNRSVTVHELHKKYGPYVRIAPGHLSVADPASLQEIYAHGNGAIKSEFYEAFVSIQPGLFNIRDRVAHSRKRKIVSHIFSQKSVLDFEPHVREYVKMLLQQWDRLHDLALKGESGSEGEGWTGRDGKLWLDCLPWFNYLAFDIIGDLAFGTPFGMLTACQDYAPVAKVSENYGKDGSHGEVVGLPAVQILNERGEYSASMGVLPMWMRPYVKRYIPWYSKGNVAVQNLSGIAVAAVAKRINAQTDRVDLLSKLQQGKDDEGKPMGIGELTAEALTQLIAGSDTTSNTSCAITYYLAANPRVQKKLQQELDEVLGNDDDPVSNFDAIKRLTYMDAVINEVLRIYSTSGIGLPRAAPEGGMVVLGKHFPSGAVLSTPTYTIHRDQETWGEDSDDFRPERWFEREPEKIQKAFNPFSFGPRACVGRNLASMELQIIISSVLRHYSFVLESPEKELVVKEGFLRKPTECRVGITRRNV
ncbi:hypothetical protein EVG20_g3094 [Dentipellis fragilis]|uniref:Uncharacterized protein n=1 Tax=Dentipellis fragilis TaxID=205917 RepID=A0A4Y9Z544_9AGAM|nr:hypothetical protein EVG20_g3094 [Dentipellis fragilis]